MDESRRFASKVYCEACDKIFDSKSDYDRHLSSHSGTSCESCPLDSFASLIGRIFKRSGN